MNFLTETKPFQVSHIIQEPSPLYLPDDNNKNNHQTSNNLPYENEKGLNSVWTKNNFVNRSKVKPDLNLNLKSTKMSWSDDKNHDDEEEVKGKTENNESSPSHHARRPMNAFLIFCKKHRPIVREKFPTLENRGVTRILGEWWAQLDASDKESYTKLAKEYKDAFLSANPDFRWYKLPAPPLRTLSQRPNNILKPTSPTTLPKHPTSSPEAEFNPGKLADESQLGSLTSLMKMNGFANNNNNSDNKFSDPDMKTLNYNYNNNNDECLYNTNSSDLPPKPIKKRINDNFNDNNQEKNVSESILKSNSNTDISSSYLNTREQLDDHDSYKVCHEPENMTQQELLDKVVDSMFSDNSDEIFIEKNGLRETRKSGRSCKGKRYAKFMVEGKLLGNKRENKLTQQKNVDINQKFENELNNKMENLNKPEIQTPKLDLGNTIKRLAERTHFKIEDTNNDVTENVKNEERTSGTSEEPFTKNSHGDFNLDLRIKNLPSLSYDTYMQRKRESKKRKVRAKTEHPEAKIEQKNELTGSKKRKNKQSITHLDPVAKNLPNDLSGLATLAEVAANTEKINEI